MTRFLQLTATVALALGSVSAPAMASTVVDGKCTSVASISGCLFDGNINGNANGNANSFISAQNAYNLYNDTHPSANPDILLNYLGDTEAGFVGSYTGAGGTSGTWTLGAGALANFVAVKSSTNFVLYQITPANSGAWSTAGLLNKNGQQQALSHLVFFGTQSAVPEPAAWMTMILGMAGIGFSMRRKKQSDTRLRLA
jgi:hypothetical protein